MHRFYLPGVAPTGAVLELTRREAHHAAHVLRVKQGERVCVLDGAGREYDCEVQEVSRDTVRLGVRQQQKIPRLPFELVLVQAVTKSRAMDLIVQKATELGVSRIIPLLSDRSAVQLEGEGLAAKAAKWQTAAAEAIKQCGLSWLPQIDAPLTPREYVARNDSFELTLIASLQPDRRSPRSVLNAFASDRGRMPKSVAVWIGPEGDFTPAELHLAKSAGAVPISLGPLILRSETAALYCLSILSYELQSPAGKGD